MQQPDLLGPPLLKVRPPPDQIGPRLWVKRLAIWKEAGGEKIRDITFRPGLNIVWSPDGTDAFSTELPTGAIGHGSGKTLFCRLLRYCLGEERYAPEDQRDRVGAAFPDGLVGAEIMLDGVCWAVLRPLGIRRRHMAVAGGDLDEIASGEMAATGIDPLLNAIEQSILTNDLAELISGARSDRRAWPIALAWLTRDQECRFSDVLEWRATASNSESPVRGMTRTEKLIALRAFIIAITPEERAKRKEVSDLEDELKALEQDIGHRRWEIDNTQRRMSTALEMTHEPIDHDPIALALLREKAQFRLSQAANLPEPEAKPDIEATRQRYREAQAAYSEVDHERTRIDITIPIRERELSRLRGERPGLSSSRNDAENPICPYCDVPIDRALAEKCGLSDRLPDLEACRRRWDDLQRQQGNLEAELVRLRSDRALTLEGLALAQQRVDRFSNAVIAIEQAQDARTGTWYSARRLVDDVEGLASLADAQERAMASVRSIGSQLDAERDRLGALREKQSRVFANLTEKFDPIIRTLLGLDAKGHVTLNGNGLDLSVQKGGDRSTAAIESLKVLAFDLSVLCMSIEGASRVPAILIHDSPREADLGLSIYHKLFRLVMEIEKCAETPSFQYIITTTTPPPEDLALEPWLRLTLRGSPGVDRLMKCDL